MRPPSASPTGICTTCGSPTAMTFYGPIGFSVCRDELNPNADDEGQHLVNHTHPSTTPEGDT